MISELSTKSLYLFPYFVVENHVLWVGILYPL